MGMSTNVVGFKPPDGKWKKMKAIYDACIDAGVYPPKQVEEFFGFEKPDSAGVEVELKKHTCCSEYKAEAQSGFEIDVTKLPADVKIIRFFNGW